MFILIRLGGATDMFATFLIMAPNTVIHLIRLVCFLYQLSLFGILLDVETMGHVGISIYMVYTTVEKVGVDEI